MEIDVPYIGYANCHVSLKVAEKLIAVGTAIGTHSAASAQDDGRLATIGVGRGHLTDLGLLRVPVVAVQAAQGQAVNPAHGGQDGDGDQVVDDSETA